MSSGVGFIQASGSQLWLDGKQFVVVGANNYYLGFGSDAMVESVLAMAGRMGLNTLRTWAFLDCGSAPSGVAPAGAKDGVYFHWFNSDSGRPDFNDGADGLERLDRTIYLAEKAGLRLILPFVNYWDDFGGVNQYLQWFAVRGREQFYLHPEVKQAYREYVEHLLLRVNTKTGRLYRDEPAILAWELANEPRCLDRNGVEILTGWWTEMSGFVRSLDPNHLIGVGEGYFRRSLAFGHELYNGVHGVDCERLLGLANVDFGTCHLYPSFAPKEAATEFGARWIREHMEAGDRANKPMLIEEYGVKIDATGPSRKAVFERWLGEVADGEGAGALVWMIAGEGADGQPYPDYDHYTVYEGASGDMSSTDIDVE